MVTQRRGADVSGFDVEALENAVNESDRDRIHRLFGEAGARFSGASRLAVMAEVSKLLRQVCDRGRIEGELRLEDSFLEALRMVALCADSEGAMEVLERFFLSLCAQGGSPAFRDSDRQTYVRRAIEYMHRAYGNSDLKVAEVAHYAYISPSYLTLLIKRETGRTFSEILTEIRLEQAAYLLAETDRRTYEIAARCGFANATYFSTVFRRSYGMAPTEYRRRRRAPFGSVQNGDILN